VEISGDPVPVQKAYRFKPLSELQQGIAKGGPGSGNFGHAGRPGERGGSVSGGGDGSVENEADRVGRLHVNVGQSVNGLKRTMNQLRVSAAHGAENTRNSEYSQADRDRWARDYVSDKKRFSDSIRSAFRSSGVELPKEKDAGISKKEQGKREALSAKGFAVSSGAEQSDEVGKAEQEMRGVLSAAERKISDLFEAGRRSDFAGGEDKTLETLKGSLRKAFADYQ